jgi:L-alanine-DL-glutamate epimerase-like enolase superfamily enzyme
MKITDVKLLVLEDPQSKTSSGHAIAQVPGLRRIQYTHTGRKAAGPPQSAQQNFIEVHTDAGLIGRCTTTMNPYQADILRYHATGRSPWDREGLFQQFYKGTRWVYQPPGWFGDFDNCLWDILGRAASSATSTPTWAAA